MIDGRTRRTGSLAALAVSVLLVAGCEPYAEKTARDEADAADTAAVEQPETSGDSLGGTPGNPSLAGARENAENLVDRHNQRQEELEDLMDQ